MSKIIGIYILGLLIDLMTEILHHIIIFNLFYLIQELELFLTLHLHSKCHHNFQVNLLYIIIYSNTDTLVEEIFPRRYFRDHPDVGNINCGPKDQQDFGAN